ncbi:MAG TPA: YceI family protein [Bryobacteraceae bacterium]|nr:YceI family protein [Bryobacteraceae bacterium]
MSTNTYDIDPTHSSAHFKVRHLMISWVRGEFTKVSGKVTFDDANPAASSVTAEIDVNSINTREPDRDKHLLSADFLDAANYPTIKFQSTGVARDGSGEYKLNGNLTIRGITHPVVLEVDSVTPEIKDPWGFFRRGAAATTKISRKEFGAAFHQVLETGGVVVGDEVEISIDVELVRKA